MHAIASNDPRLGARESSGAASASGPFVDRIDDLDDGERIRVTSLAALVELFHPSLDVVGEFHPTQAEAMPDVYQSLLAHNDHMTVTVEAWHNSLVDLRVLNEIRQDEHYAREILLTRQRDNRPVQYGVMRIDMTRLPEIVRMEIESQALPLGRILIRRHVLRQVELEKLWGVKPGKFLQDCLEVTSDQELYGRTARILVAGNPAVELLEIVTI